MELRRGDLSGGQYLGPAIAARYGGALTRVNLATEHHITDEQWVELRRALQAEPDALPPNGMEGK